MDDPTRAQLQETLTKVNDFLPEALGSSREGRLTADQAKSLERKDRSDRRLLFLVGLVGRSGCRRLPGVGRGEDGAERAPASLRGVRRTRSRASSDGPGPLLEGVRHGSGAGGGRYGARARNARGQQHRRWAANLRLHHRWDRRQPIPREREAKAFVEGQYYRAYYLPHAGKLVNIEVLDP